jgi:hypothetical protein
MDASTILLAVGKLDHNATVADAFVFSAFRVVSGCTTAIAQTIYYSSDSAHARANLLRSVAEVCCDEPEKQLIKTLIDAADKTNKQRQQIMHGVVFYDAPDGVPVGLLRPRKQGEQKPVTDGWLDDLMRHSREGLLSAKAAFEALCERRGIPANVEFE